MRSLHVSAFLAHCVLLETRMVMLNILCSSAGNLIKVENVFFEALERLGSPHDRVSDVRCLCVDSGHSGRCRDCKRYGHRM